MSVQSQTELSGPEVRSCHAYSFRANSQGSCFVMQPALEMLAKIEAPIAIVAHDAGAANHISAWFANPLTTKVFGSFGGPARDIFGRQCPWIATAHFSQLVPQCRTLISGTGWASAYEHDARKLAKELGCHSIAVIDHWTNYRARFVRDSELILPDEIWVTDEYAKGLAELEFPEIPTIQQENSYLESLVGEVLQHDHSKMTSCEGNILYVLEPIRQAWLGKPLSGEFQALEFFVANLDALRLGDIPSIRLRPHPSDPAGKYDQWIESHGGLRISLDVSSTLAESISWADVVLGCHTYAMVVALAAGRRVISSIPPWAPPCVLPQAGILKLADLVR